MILDSRGVTITTQAPIRDLEEAVDTAIHSSRQIIRTISRGPANHAK